MDIPNERSSHSVPTPRGGGIAIVMVMSLLIGILLIWGFEYRSILVAYLAGGLIVAIVGFLDDRKHVAARVRLLVHFAAAAVILVAVGRLPSLSVLGSQLDLGIVNSLLAAVFIVWLLNLYNFMDGIDGIASAEAVTVAGGAAVLLWLGAATDFAKLAATLAAVNLGFLVWNWPPAKIFMGDVGSGFVGFCFGAMAMITCAKGALSIWVWLILLGAFLVDSTVTLLRRVVRRDLFYEAHRSHAYQYASRKVGSHLRVTVAVCTINLLWLLPMAFLVTAHRLNGLVGVLVAYLPLLALALHFNAGAKELQER